MLRYALIGLLFLAAGFSLDSMAAERPTEPFDRAILEARAADLARRRHVQPPRPEASGRERLTYDQYRAIRFKRDASIWARENRTFSLDLFYPGFIFDTPVNVNLVVGKTARRVLFTNDVFDYGPEVPVIESRDGLGYSGFRVRAPINRPDYPDEFLVFQGASYFRAVARDQVYGISARGLAVRTARPEGEEFPAFTDFWIERPAKGAEQVVIHALLQSRSVVGAYTFTARAGEETVLDVDAMLFPRVDIEAFGIAPLTSMFLFDATNRARFDDYRDAVHDSDGLLILNGRNERLWRPLANPRALQVSSFLDDDPKGFGLMQRKRRFGDFEDAEAQYDRRPSAWVEPRGAWGPGHVELVEIPTDLEINDNIVTYWQPRKPLAAGKPARFAYRLRFTAEPLDESLARVVATRVGQALQSESQRSFVIDFRVAGPVPPELKLRVSTSAGKVLAPRGQFVPQSGVYRVSFELDPGRAGLAELRAEVLSKGRPWGETWLYRWTR
jgi:periplasmic glucans biosynthesis protein